MALEPERREEIKDWIKASDRDLPMLVSQAAWAQACAELLYALEQAEGRRV